ncbi:MAG TPA: hypothetical protein VJA23_00325 [Candidatus Nanoarchaeia archaeon]|nr:hypothetical protein [Candidatus Nanoarchaeia archaeon]
METDMRKTRTCEKCKAAVPLNQVRLFPKSADQNLMVCGRCCQELMNRTSSLDNSGPVRNTPRYKSKPEPKIEIKPAPVINRPVMAVVAASEKANVPRWAAKKVELKQPEHTPAVSKVIDVKERPYPVIKSTPYQPNPARNVSRHTINPLPDPEYAKYKCMRCNYNFKADIAKAGLTYNLVCPNCGRAEKIQRLEPWS